MNEDIARAMAAAISCGACGKRYDPAGIEVISASKGIWYLRAVCAACHVTCAIAVILRDGKPKLYTDLTENELERFRNMETVSEDDLLAMHRFLRDFDGELSSLFHPDNRSS